MEGRLSTLFEMMSKLLQIRSPKREAAEVEVPGDWWGFPFCSLGASRYFGDKEIGGTVDGWILAAGPFA
jgi:hypothetical protein